jgi:phosphatidate cytidylyltransferase
VGIKDFSNLLGEHGGLVDRFDSVLFVAVFWKII